MRVIILILMCILVTSALAESYQGIPVSTLVRVPYPWGSTAFSPNTDTAEMLKDARYAAMVYISGRTSTQQPSAYDESLAFARAASARKYLIERGVSPLKIMMNYVSGDDFIADNSTPEGKRANQRVDIEMMFVPMY
ncbi:MAG: OmpA family protein [Candidatus Thiodiazotropha sp. (ex Dulcina madagascariensis)]|nr:OmpA family protein [Candidatus Thiodiazotropha sp. (ex Dulcina madagascariensis)]